MAWKDRYIDKFYIVAGVLDVIFGEINNFDDEGMYIAMGNGYRLSYFPNRFSYAGENWYYPAGTMIASIIVLP